MARFFLTADVVGGLADELRRHGHDVITLDQSGLVAPELGSDDFGKVGAWVEQRLSYAKGENRITITQDRSFHTWRWKVHRHPGILACEAEAETSPTELIDLIERELRQREDFAGRYVWLRTPAQALQADFQLAALTGKTAKVRQLLEQNTDLNLGAALQQACDRGHAETARLLIDSGADVNYKSKGTLTPLMCACATMRLAGTRPELGTREEFGEIVEMLLAQGAEVNAQDNDGRTALHHIVENYSNPELEDRLVAAGADVTLQNNEGLAPAAYRNRWAASLPPPLYEVADVLKAADPNDVLDKLCNNFSPATSNLNDWEAGLYGLWRFDWNVHCYGFIEGFERLAGDKLRQLYFVIEAIGHIKLREWLEEAVAVLAPDLKPDRYGEFQMPAELTGDQKANLDRLEDVFYELSGKIDSLVYDFLRKNEHLFGWRYGDRKNRR